VDALAEFLASGLADLLAPAHLQPDGSAGLGWPCEPQPPAEPQPPVEAAARAAVPLLEEGAALMVVWQT